MGKMKFGCIVGGALLGIGVAASPIIDNKETIANEYQKEIERVIKSGEIKDCSDEESPIDKLICEENNKLVIETQNIDRKKQEIDRINEDTDRIKKEIDRINEDTDRIKQETDKKKQEIDRINEDTDRINEEIDRINEEILKVVSDTLEEM